MSSIFLNLLCFDVPFVGNVAQSEEGPSLWVWILLIAAGIVATITDLRTMLIPNWLTLPLLVAGLTYSGIVAGMPGVVDSLKGAGMAGGVFLAAYAFARGGAGDAKLMMAFGSWLGFQSATVLLLSVAIVGFFCSNGAYCEALRHHPNSKRYFSSNHDDQIGIFTISKGPQVKSG